MNTDAGAARAERFGRWATDAARAAGFDVDGQRSGGRVAIAKATGMSPSSVGRMLAGKTLPSPRAYAALAKVFRRPLREVLIEAGAATDDQLEATAAAAIEARRLDPQEAAQRVGIKHPSNVRLFVSMVEQMLQQESENPDVA